MCPNKPPGPPEVGGRATVKNSGMKFGTVCAGSDKEWADIVGTGCSGSGYAFSIFHFFMFVNKNS